MQGLQAHRPIAVQMNKKSHVSWLMQMVNSFSTELESTNILQEAATRDGQGEHTHTQPDSSLTSEMVF
jgi:hypothetical protein